MKARTPVKDVTPNKLLYARYLPKKNESKKLTQAVELRCRQCETIKTVRFGPKWKPPSEGIQAMCKNDRCLAHTVHDFVRVIPAKKIS